MKPISVILLIIGLILVVGANIYDNSMLYASGVVGFLWMATAVSSKK